MTHQEQVREVVKQSLEIIDRMYELYGSSTYDGSGVFIDTKFMGELWKESEFLQDMSALMRDRYGS